MNKNGNCIYNCMTIIFDKFIQMAGSLNIAVHIRYYYIQLIGQQKIEESVYFLQIADSFTQFVLDKNEEMCSIN